MGVGDICLYVILLRRCDRNVRRSSTCFISKNRLKNLETGPYTQAEAERAGGMGSYVAPKTVKVKTQLDKNQMDESNDG